MKWFKFYGQDYLSDPKMLSLSASERSCWITLLAYSSVNDNGMITHLDEDMLMSQAGISHTHDEWDGTLGVLKKLEKLQMITIDNAMITVLNWKKRQETNLSSYERVKRHREKKRNDNAMITLEENRIEENRREKRENAEISKEISSSSLDEVKEVQLDSDGEEVGNKVSRRKTEPVTQQYKRIREEFYRQSMKHIQRRSSDFEKSPFKAWKVIKFGLTVLSEEKIIDMFDWWFTGGPREKTDAQLIQITGVFSSTNIDNYKIENGQ